MNFWYKVWEIIPGLSSVMTLLLLIILSATNPIFVATVVLIYACYWLVRVAMMAVLLIMSYRRFRREIKIDWLRKLESEFGELYKKIYHLVIVPTYKEDIGVLRRTLEAIARSNYPLERVVVAVAFEARDTRGSIDYPPIVKSEFATRFRELLITIHPANIEGEVIGKGPNITWSARRAHEYFLSQKINEEDVIVTTLDADNLVDPNYFANLTWAYLNTPDAIYKSFQPLPMFFNNIWNVPLPVKITALGSTFWQMIQSVRPHFLRNFSSHAQSLAGLVKTDYWSVKTIVEDGHQYWRSYYAFEGNHEVVPIYVPIYMDAVEDETVLATFRAQYLQRRRWFWGVSDLPYVFTKNLEHPEVPFFEKWLQFLRLWDAHFNLATQSFILLIGWLPISLNPELRSTVFGYNFPIVYRFLLLATSVGLVVTMAITIFIVPPKSGTKHSPLIIIKEILLAPVLLPLSAIFFSALPSLEAQTRMLIGKPLNVFNVTKKKAA